jgi:hypothetical protein
MQLHSLLHGILLQLTLMLMMSYERILKDSYHNEGYIAFIK